VKKGGIMKLPKKITIPEGILNESDLDGLADVVSEYLSDTYGFCHKGFNLSIVASEIQWDKSE